MVIAIRYDKELVHDKYPGMYAVCEIFMLTNLELLTVYPWRDGHHHKSYPTSDAVMLTYRSSLIEEVPQLTIQIIYMFITRVYDGAAMMSVVIAVIDLLWSSFTKQNIQGFFDRNDNEKTFRNDQRDDAVAAPNAEEVARARKVEAEAEEAEAKRDIALEQARKSKAEREEAETKAEEAKQALVISESTDPLGRRPASRRTSNGTAAAEAPLSPSADVQISIPDDDSAYTGDESVSEQKDEASHVAEEDGFVGPGQQPSLSSTRTRT